VVRATDAPQGVSVHSHSAVRVAADGGFGAQRQPDGARAVADAGAGFAGVSYEGRAAGGFHRGACSCGNVRFH